MRRSVLLALLVLVVAGVATQVASAATPPSFAKAARVSRAAAPTHRLESCVRLRTPVVVCTLYRDRGAWRYQRVVRVSARRTVAGPPRRFCRVRGRNRCAFRLPSA